MISILHRYIAKQVMIATLLVIVVIVGLAFVIGLLSELRDIGVGDYGVGEAIIHITLQLPRIIYDFFPMLMLLGGVMGLGVLSANQELVTMRTSGVSLWSIVKAVMLAAIVLIIFATILGETVAPHTTFLANKRKFSDQNNGQVVVTEGGVWMHEGNNFLHINRVTDKNHLEGVTRYQFDTNHQLLAAYYVKTLEFTKHQWLLHDLVKTTFNRDKTNSIEAVRATWDLKLNPSLINVGLIEPSEMTLHHLLAYSQHLEENGLQAGFFELEFWKRLVQPFTTLVMILLAIPFALSAPRSLTMGLKILFGIMVGLVFYIFNALVGQFSIVFQLSPLFAALFPTVLFALIGYGVMTRVRT